MAQLAGSKRDSTGRALPQHPSKTRAFGTHPNPQDPQEPKEQSKIPNQSKSILLDTWHAHAFDEGSSPGSSDQTWMSNELLSSVASTPYNYNLEPLKPTAQYSNLAQYPATPFDAYIEPHNHESGPCSMEPCPLELLLNQQYPPCAAASPPCTDPTCDDVLECQAQDGLCHPFQYVGDICCDQVCHSDFHGSDICFNEKCPEATRCPSPCYSQDCHVPPCESTKTTIPRLGFDDGCSPHGTNCQPHCGCIDPQFLSRPSTECSHHEAHSSYASHFAHFSNTSRNHVMTDDSVRHDVYKDLSANSILETSYQFKNTHGGRVNHDFDLAFEHSKGGHASNSDSTKKDAFTRPSSIPSSPQIHPIPKFQTLLDVVATTDDLKCQWCIPGASGEPDIICAQRFDSAEDLHQHVEKKHIDGLIREDKESNGFFCRWSGCDRYLCRSFQARPKLKRHAQTHTLYKPFACHQCGIQMKTKDAMEKHERTHTGERPYECKIQGCKKVFATSTELKTHMVVHSGEKPHQCPICNESFADSSNLSKHKKTHFPPRFICPEPGCETRTKRWDQMRRHLQTQKHGPAELLTDKKAQEAYKFQLSRISEQPNSMEQSKAGVDGL